MIFVPFMLIQNQPPVDIEQKATAVKQRKGPQGLRQNSTGPNSPNIVTGDGSTINIGPKLSGLLVAAPNGKRPALRIAVPNGALVLNCGNNFACSNQAKFVALRVLGEDLVTVHRIGGGISIGALVYSTDGRIVADIENNVFSVNPNNYFKIKNPNKSTLVVYDQYNNESLNVKFVATDYLVVKGRFYKPGYGTITINDDMISTPNGKMSDNFATIMGEGGVAFGFEPPKPRRSMP
jgi:hypothetical protein